MIWFVCTQQIETKKKLPTLEMRIKKLIWVQKEAGEKTGNGVHLKDKNCYCFVWRKEQVKNIKSENVFLKKKIIVGDY